MVDFFFMFFFVKWFLNVLYHSALETKVKLMSLWHLPDLQEEEEQAFVHSVIWMPKKPLNNTVLAPVNCIYRVKRCKQASKLTLASLHLVSGLHQTASVKLYCAHFPATRTSALQFQQVVISL